MWLKKTPEEIQKVVKKKHIDRIKMSIFYFSLVFFGGTFLDRRHFFTPADEIIQKMPWVFLMGVICALVYYKFKKVTPSVYMCLNCGSLPKYEEKKICQCGNAIVDLEYYTWKDV